MKEFGMRINEAVICLIIVFIPFQLDFENYGGEI